MTLAGAVGAALAVVCGVLALGRPVPLPRFSHPDAGPLLECGWSASLRRWECLRLACLVPAALVALAAGGSPLLLAPAVAALVPSVVVRERAGAARARARTALTAGLVAIHAGLRSGLALAAALRGGAEATGDRLARRPLDRALARFALGAPLDEALADAASREGDERMRLALTTLALGIAERLSADRLAALVASVAERAAFDDRLDEEVRARTGGLRVQLVLLALVVPALAGYLALTTPGVAATLTGPLGRTVLLPVAAGLEIGGLVLGRRAVRGATR